MDVEGTLLFALSTLVNVPRPGNFTAIDLEMPKTVLPGGVCNRKWQFESRRLLHELVTCECSLTSPVTSNSARQATTSSSPTSQSSARQIAASVE